jgi:hypothetical protein
MDRGSIRPFLVAKKLGEPSSPAVPKETETAPASSSPSKHTPARKGRKAAARASYVEQTDEEWLEAIETGEEAEGVGRDQRRVVEDAQTIGEEHTRKQASPSLLFFS